MLRRAVNGVCFFAFLMGATRSLTIGQTITEAVLVVLWFGCNAKVTVGAVR